MVIVFFLILFLCDGYYVCVLYLCTIYTVQYDNCESFLMFTSAINGCFQPFLNKIYRLPQHTQTQSSSTILLLMTVLAQHLKKYIYNHVSGSVTGFCPRFHNVCHYFNYHWHRCVLSLLFDIITVSWCMHCLFSKNCLF